MMAKILAYTSPAIGHLFPLTPVLSELRRRSHTVHLRTLAGWVETMRALGFSADAVDPAIEEIRHRDYLATGPKAKLQAAADVFMERGRFDGPDLARTLDEIRPDVLIVDVNSWGAAAAAEAWGGRWLSFSPYTPPLRSRGTPPFGPGLAPAGGPLGAMRDAVVRRLVLGVVEKVMTPPINDLREKMGLGPIGSVDEMLRRVPLTLVTTAKPFEYPVTDWGPDVVMIGATTWEPDLAAPDWLAEIDSPIILVSTSSEFQDDGVLVKTAIKAFADGPFHVVATIPSGMALGTRLPSNVTVADFLPHGLVLDRAAVAITHGGMGATQKALARGVPVCVVPFGRDQMEVARRVEVSDSGVRLAVRRLSPERLRVAVEAAIGKREGARRVAEGYAAAGGARTAADAIESRLLGIERVVAGG